MQSKSSFNINTTVTAVILVVLTGIVVLGGIKRIGSAAEFIVPFYGRSIYFDGIDNYNS